jgi:hypothetical protein
MNWNVRRPWVRGFRSEPFAQRPTIGGAPMLQSCLGCLLLATLAFSASTQAGKDPKNATEWFQRADDEMNLRAPGSTPFHMKVAFHALPGLVLDKEESAQIISGDGTYEETWVAPRRWRREVTLGSYHAVEVQSQTARKMQASSEYEPSRVLMLLEALPYPIPRDLSSPSLSEGHQKWKIENGAVGGLSYVRISRTLGPQDVVHTYLFLPTGVLVQSVEVGIVTSWQDQTSFGGKLVPRHFGVQGGTRELLTAHLTVEPAGTVNPAAFELPGESAEPGTTLRPIHAYEYSLPLPMTTYSWGGSQVLTRGIIRHILDRHGVTREVEVLDSPNPGALETFLRLIRGDRFHPEKIDKSPCEVALWKAW